MKLGGLLRSPSPHALLTLPIQLIDGLQHNQPACYCPARCCCAGNTPHVHPRAAEISTVVRGEYPAAALCLRIVKPPSNVTRIRMCVPVTATAMWPMPLCPPMDDEGA